MRVGPKKMAGLVGGATVAGGSVIGFRAEAFDLLIGAGAALLALAVLMPLWLLVEVRRTEHRLHGAMDRLFGRDAPTIDPEVIESIQADLSALHGTALGQARVLGTVEDRLAGMEARLDATLPRP